MVRSAWHRADLKVDGRRDGEAFFTARHLMEAHRVDSRAIYTLSRRSDAAKGIASFLEKRAPRYRARVSSDMPLFYPWWDEPDWE